MGFALRGYAARFPVVVVGCYIDWLVVDDQLYGLLDFSVVRAHARAFGS